MVAQKVMIRPQARAATGLRLVGPDPRMRDEYLAFRDEFLAAGGRISPYVLRMDPAHWRRFIWKLRLYGRGIRLPAGFVPNSTWWLVDERKRILGVSNIRHRLNGRLRMCGGHIGGGIRPSERNQGYARELLRLSLIKGRELGIREFLLVCEEDNHASRKVLESAGGVLERAVRFEERTWLHFRVRP